MNVLIKAIGNLQGVFRPQYDYRPLPTPVGVEIIGEGNDIFYLGPELDKQLMRSDRLNYMNDLRVAIKEKQYEQAGNSN